MFTTMTIAYLVLVVSSTL